MKKFVILAPANVEFELVRTADTSDSIIVMPMADNFVKVSLTPCTKTAEEVTEPETTSNENDLL